MFLLVLAVTFLAAKTITKQDFERFNDMEESLVEPPQMFEDDPHQQDIFIIDYAEQTTCIKKSEKSSPLAEGKNCRNSNLFLTFLRSPGNIFNNRFIDVSM